MIDYIKFTLDSKEYYLIQNPDGLWEKSITAPDVAGRYDVILEILADGIITIIDSTDPRYSFYIDTIEQAESISHIQDYVPAFMADILELKEIYLTEDAELDTIYMETIHLDNNHFIRTASAEIILALENFLGVKGGGTLMQRKDYLIALMQKGKKLNTNSILEIAKTITGSTCLITFYGGDEMGNPYPTYGFLRVQVLSPENNKDYRYDDIFRTIRPMVPAHIKIVVEKYFALWEDIRYNFLDWSQVKLRTDWGAVRNYIPPQ